MKFDELNLMSNRIVEVADEFSGPDFPSIQENQGSSSQDLQLITKTFKISTQNHGYSRIVKVYELKVNGKIIKITDMLTALPVELNDAYNEMVQSQSQEFPEEQSFSVFLNQQNENENENPTDISGKKELKNDEDSIDLEETIQKSVAERTEQIIPNQSVQKNSNSGIQEASLKAVSPKSLDKYEKQEESTLESSRKSIKKQVFSISHKPIRKERVIEKPTSSSLAFASHPEIHFKHVLESM